MAPAIADAEGMSLLDGAPKPPLPSMSWDSVVEKGSSEQDSDSESSESQGDSEPGADTPPAPPSTPATFSSAGGEGVGSLHLGLPEKPRTPVTEPEPAPEPTATNPSTTLPTPSFSMSPVKLDAASLSGPTSVRPARLAEPDSDIEETIGRAAARVEQPGLLSQPAPAAEPESLAQTTPAPVAPQAEAPVPDVDASPVSEVAPAPVPDVALPATAELPATVASEVPAAAPPSVPAAPPAPAVAPAPAPSNSFSLPQQAARSTMGAGFDPLSVHLDNQPSSRAARRQKSGSGIGVILVLLLVAGLVAAGVVFGRPYLFPNEWDESSKVFAEDIEAVRGSEFVEPLTVVAEASTAYRSRVGDQLLGDWEAQLPMWRALGLAAGGTEREVLDSLIADRSPAIYSIADGQVYHDAALPIVDLDPNVTHVMAIAALDQDFGFTQSSGARSLLDAAMTDAHVAQQAAAIQQASSAPTALRVSDDAPLAFLPPVLDYQLVAPTVFTELLPDVGAGATNPLDGIRRNGPGPINETEITLAPAADLAEGETLVGDYRPMDRSFWYLTFATHVDANTARVMSNELTRASIGEVDVAGTSCYSATFYSPDVDGIAAISGGLATWASAAAPELQASVVPIDATTMQLRTCDPGDVFTSNARFGVARDLIAWQAVELAATTAVLANGGDQSQIDLAVGRIASSNAVDQVLALDPTASSTEVASAARAGVAPIVSVPLTPVSDPAAPVEN